MEIQLPWVLTASVAVAVCGLLTARRDGLWYLHPRGPMGVLVALNATGLVAHRLLRGYYEQSFGLMPELVPHASLLLVSGQFGLLLGTFAVPRLLERSAGALAMEPRRWAAMAKAMAASIWLTGSTGYLALLLQGWDSVFGHYGGGQFSGDAPAAIWNVGIITVPTLVLLTVARAMAGASLAAPRFLLLAAYALLPALGSGARRDVFLGVFAVVLARSIRAGRVALRQGLAVGLAMVLLSTAITLSRSGDTLAPEDRISAMSAPNESSNFLDHALNMFGATNVLTAAMKIFPAQEPHTHGRTYLESLANVAVPHLLTGFYLFTPPAIAFHDLFYGEVRGFGIDYSLAAEAYQNFGDPGPFFAYLLLGMAVMSTYRLAARHRGLWVLIHLQVFWAGLWGLRSDSNSLLKLIAFGLAWLFFLRWLSGLRARLPVQIRR